MRTVSFSHPAVRRMAKNDFVCTYTNTEGDPTSGASISHRPSDPPGPCIRGNGKQNVQTLFLTPQGEVFHVATGFLSGDDLAEEMKFAGNMFNKLKSETNASKRRDWVVQTHQNRLQSAGFSRQEIESPPGMEMMAMMRGNGNFMGQNFNSQNRNRRSSSPNDVFSPSFALNSSAITNFQFLILSSTPTTCRNDQNYWLAMASLFSQVSPATVEKAPACTWDLSETETGPCVAMPESICLVSAIFKLRGSKCHPWDRVGNSCGENVVPERRSKSSQPNEKVRVNYQLTRTFFVRLPDRWPTSSLAIGRAFEIGRV